MCPRILTNPPSGMESKIVRLAFHIRPGSWQVLSEIRALMYGLLFWADAYWALFTTKTSSIKSPASQLRRYNLLPIVMMLVRVLGRIGNFGGDPARRGVPLWAGLRVNSYLQLRYNNGKES